MRPVGRCGRLAETGFGPEPRERPELSCPTGRRREPGKPDRAGVARPDRPYPRDVPGGCPAFESSARTPTDQTEQPGLPIMGVRPAPGQRARHGVGVWPKEGPALALG